MLTFKDPNYKDYRIFHYASKTPEKFTNALFLMGAYMLIIMKHQPSDILTKFSNYLPHARPFRDASKGECHYDCTIEHCLHGLFFALRHGWYKFSEFDVKEYEYYERVENGDLNWIIPNKFIAFMGPIKERTQG